MADLSPIALDGGRLRRVDETTDRLTVGAILRALGSLTFEDEDNGPVTLAALIKYTQPRENLDLVGTIDGVNLVYTLPGGEKGIVEALGATIKVQINGVDYFGDGEDFTLSESGGGGTGFDTVTLIHFAPRVGDRVTTSYYKET
jgi:hypothetical protein